MSGCLEADARGGEGLALRVTHREPSIFGGMWQIVLLEKDRRAA